MPQQISRPYSALSRRGIELVQGHVGRGTDAGRLTLLASSMPFKCPAAPHEAAILLRWDFLRRGLSDLVQINLYSPEPTPAP